MATVVDQSPDKSRPTYGWHHKSSKRRSIHYYSDHAHHKSRPHSPASWHASPSWRTVPSPFRLCRLSTTLQQTFRTTNSCNNYMYTIISHSNILTFCLAGFCFARFLPTTFIYLLFVFINVVLTLLIYLWQKKRIYSSKSATFQTATLPLTEISCQS